MTKAQLVADIAALDESIARIKDLGTSYVNQYDPTLTAVECVAALEGMRAAKVRRLNDEALLISIPEESPPPVTLPEGTTIEDLGLSVMGPDYTPVSWRDARGLLDDAHDD